MGRLPQPKRYQFGALVGRRAACLCNPAATGRAYSAPLSGAPRPHPQAPKGPPHGRRNKSPGFIPFCRSGDRNFSIGRPNRDGDIFRNGREGQFLRRRGVLGGIGLTCIGEGSKTAERGTFGGFVVKSQYRGGMGYES